MDGAAGRGPARPRGPAAQPADHRTARRSTGAGSTASCPRAELDAAVDDYCDGLLEKMPEIVRATKVQLDFWKDLAWAATIRMAREWLTVHAGSAR